MLRFLYGRSIRVKFSVARPELLPNATPLPNLERIYVSSLRMFCCQFMMISLQFQLVMIQGVVIAEPLGLAVRGMTTAIYHKTW